MKIDKLKKYFKRVLKGKASITYGMIIALILGAGMYTEVRAETDAVAVAQGNAEVTIEAFNYGWIDKTGDYGMYAEAVAQGNAKATSDAINHGWIYNTGDYGMYAKAEAVGNGTAIAKVINTEYGTITNSGNYRMGAEGSGAEAVNEGFLDTGFDGYVVMNGTDSATITNNGTIKIDVWHNLGVGMDVDGGATAVNNGKIYLHGISSLNYLEEGIGMKGIGLDTTITNNGVININPSHNLGVAMYVDGGATAINNENIYLNGYSNDIADKGIGMKGTGLDTTITNNGTITTNTSHDYGVAMYVDGGATAVNNGKIYLHGYNGVGMHATGLGSTIVNETEGRIYLSGTQNIASRNDQNDPTDWETADPAPADGIINGKDSQGNIGMKIEDGARMINKGKIVFKPNW